MARLRQASSCPLAAPGGSWLLEANSGSRGGWGRALASHASLPLALLSLWGPHTAPVCLSTRGGRGGWSDGLSIDSFPLPTERARTRDCATPRRRRRRERMASVSGDFRSDTVTRPTAAMYEAMVSAALGDDVFQDDPTVVELEEEVASLLGKEAAVFVTTGTLSNQLALRTHVGPLQEVLCDHRSHIHVWEVGGIHALCGASVAPAVPEPGNRFLCEDAVRANTRSDHSLYHQPVTRLLSLEQTLNGEIMPLQQLAAACDEARVLGLATHLDGARIWNACAATGTSPAEYAAHFDTVSVCLSKGLGAPVGSVLTGSRTAIDKARHYRKLYGGGWRLSLIHI